MFKFIVVAAMAISASQAFPGGYLAKGGVVDFQRPLDYIPSAKQAGKAEINIILLFEMGL